MTILGLDLSDPAIVAGFLLGGWAAGIAAGAASVVLTFMYRRTR